MPLWASLNPLQLALIVVVEVWKSISAPVPSLTVPADGAVLSTVKVAVEGLDMLPAASITNSLYAPASAGAGIVVAVPPAVVMVAPATKLVVPDGANHTLLVAFPELTIVTDAPPCLLTLDANTVSWFVGAVVSITMAWAAAKVPTAGKVLLASVRAAFLMVPPFSAREVVAD